MSISELHPFTGHYLVRYTNPAAERENRQMLAELLECITQKCAAAGATLIGHIKAFASQPGGGYMTASVTSANVPAQVEASTLQNHEQLNLYLVVLVYGLEVDRLAQIVAQSWEELAGQGLLLSVQPLPAPVSAIEPKEGP
jgi:hypothetical protein